MTVRILLALILLALGAAGGYAYHGDRDAAAIQTARSNYAVCASALDSKKAALERVDEQLGELRERHEAAKAAATTVLDQRDAENAALTERVAVLTESLRRTARDDASCASLDRLPVCAAVAGQLWPAAAEAAAGRHAN